MTQVARFEIHYSLVDIPAPYEGRIPRLYGNPGDIAHIGVRDARARKVPPEELRGHTITLSNYGT
ncbi:MAG: hypothetical protein ACXW2I_16080, partial [Burkholderiales bacterium]